MDFVCRSGEETSFSSHWKPNRGVRLALWSLMRVTGILVLPLGCPGALQTALNLFQTPPSVT